MKNIKKGKIIKIPGTKHTLGGEQVFVIAEIGKGFIQTKEDRPVEEYLENAKKLIDEATSAGADAVKFQTHEIEDELLNVKFDSPHFKGQDRYDWVKRNTLATPAWFWQELKKYADSKNILFFSTPMSRLAAKKLLDLDVPLWKVGSGDVEDFVLLDFIARIGKPVIISTGMVSWGELENVVEFLSHRKVPLCIMYCVSEYPAPADRFNLSSIQRLRDWYPDVVVGFSDHSVGSHELPLAAAKAGARVIEKHFSLSRDLWGSDHKVSLTPSELAELTGHLRKKKYEKVDLDKFLGDPKRELPGAENQFRPYFKKSLVAARDTEEGEVIGAEDLYAVRPLLFGKGLPSHHLEKVLGRKVKKPLKKYDPINNNSFKK
ncbi:MAG: hypothetical protein A3H68_03290 [Candidatus Taylorbacteria bacterium RIFCSPLOWO2_02_FULL_46_40]|uniref:AFP-like domain-containing protein n=1 Tax=Candidatus Taylorbacteria bacterium RIFCSPLOWO2_02_FULL_46_40 TaxID=1802329 RepID=A0A1G2P3G6_9BACT|nr:MAG: hypothetical protein A3H68_03290 [Candidatus Taylorbacteria bacterium RIFCSPLOWO2_02_FULL_46_40]